MKFNSTLLVFIHASHIALASVMLVLFWLIRDGYVLFSEPNTAIYWVEVGYFLALIGITIFSLRRITI